MNEVRKIPKITEGRRASRIIFVQYIFSQLFHNEDLDSIIDILKIENEDLKYNDKFLRALKDTFTEKIDESESLIEMFVTRDLDNLKYSIIIAAVTEFSLNDHALVISEYLKISDIFEIKPGFINGVLDNISKKFKKGPDSTNIKKIQN